VQKIQTEFKKLEEKAKSENELLAALKEARKKLILK